MRLMGENTQNTAGAPIRRPGRCVSVSATAPDMPFARHGLAHDNA